MLERVLRALNRCVLRSACACAHAHPLAFHFRKCFRAKNKKAGHGAAFSFDAPPSGREVYPCESCGLGADPHCESGLCVRCAVHFGCMCYGCCSAGGPNAGAQGGGRARASGKGKSGKKKKKKR